MARKYSVKSRYYKKADYSRENTGFKVNNFTAANELYQAGAVIVPSSTVQGKRTVSKLTVSLTDIAGTTDSAGFHWAMVYVPEGTNANQLFAKTGSVNSGSLYEPNQFVMACGYNDSSAGPIRIRTNMKRTLNSGDSISLIVGNNSPTVTGITGLVSYSIKYN